MCEFLKKEGLTLKKNLPGRKGSNRCRSTAASGLPRAGSRCPKGGKLIFIDETAFWIGMSRDLARSEKGKKAFCLRPFYKGRKMTLIGAISIEGVVVKKAIICSMKGKDFKEFVEHDLVPKLNPGDVVVMDNLNIHKMEGIEELIVPTSARVEYLPPYSPDFNQS